MSREKHQNKHWSSIFKHKIFEYMRASRLSA